MDVLLVEDKELCGACKGRCCKSSPGRFDPDDALLQGMVTVEHVTRLLRDGTAAVTCGLVGALNSRVAPILTVSARGLGKPELCLCLGDVRCAHLTNTGCSFVLGKRPLECAAIVPSKTVCKMPGHTMMEDRWAAHQEVLRDVVENISGRPWLEELTAQIDNPRRRDDFAKGARRLIAERGLATAPADIAFIADMAKSLPFHTEREGWVRSATLV